MNFNTFREVLRPPRRVRMTESVAFPQTPASLQAPFGIDYQRVLGVGCLRRQEVLERFGGSATLESFEIAALVIVSGGEVAESGQQVNVHIGGFATSLHTGRKLSVSLGEGANGDVGAG